MKLPRLFQRESLDERLGHAAKAIMLQGERGTLWYNQDKQAVWFVADGYIGSQEAICERLKPLGLEITVDDAEAKAASGWIAPTPDTGWHLVSPFDGLH